MVELLKSRRSTKEVKRRLTKEMKVNITAATAVIMIIRLA
jgi:hypothetical protein